MQPSTKSKEMHAQGDCVRITRGIAVVGQVSSRCGQPAACRSVAQAPIFMLERVRLSLGHCLAGDRENCGSPCIGTTSAVHRHVHRSKHSSLNLASVLVSVFGL